MIWIERPWIDRKPSVGWKRLRENSSVSLFEFEQLCRGAARATSEAITDLIAMDGGPSAHLWLPPLGRLYGARSSIYLTNLVTIGL